MQILQTQKQNLLKTYTPQTNNEVGSFYKAVSLDALTILSAVIFSYFYRAYLDGNTAYWGAIVSLIFFSSFSLLGTILTRGFGHRSFIVLLEVLGITLFFYDQNVFLVATAAASALVFFFLAEVLTRQELENSLEIKFMKSARTKFRKLATGIVLFVVILYAPYLAANKTVVPQKPFRVIFDSAARFLGNIYPDINLRSSLKNFAESFAYLQFNSDPQFKALPESERNLLTAQGAEKLVSELQKNIGIAIDAEQPISDVIYNLVNVSLVTWNQKFGQWFVIGWVITLFLAARGIAALFYWLVSIVAWLIYQILLAANFVHIANETRSQEVIEY